MPDVTSPPKVVPVQRPPDATFLFRPLLELPDVDATWCENVERRSLHHVATSSVLLRGPADPYMASSTCLAGLQGTCPTSGECGHFDIRRGGWCKEVIWGSSFLDTAPQLFPPKPRRRSNGRNPPRTAWRRPDHSNRNTRHKDREMCGRSGPQDSQTSSGKSMDTSPSAPGTSAHPEHPDRALPADRTTWERPTDRSPR